MVNNVDNFINIAYKEAQRAYKKREVPVGAVIVKDGKVIAKAHNLKEKKKSPLAHAEILCIEKACKKINNWRLDDCIMYVTLYPCNMCLGAIKESRINTVIYAANRENITNIDEKCIYIKDDRCLNIIQQFFKELRRK